MQKLIPPYPKSVIPKIAWWLENEADPGNGWITSNYPGSELYEAAIPAQQWYEKNIPKAIRQEELRLLKEAGYTKKTWREVLMRGSSFWFCPTPEQNELNKKLIRLMSPWIINRTPILLSYCYSTIQHAVIRGHLIRTGTKGNYQYNLPKTK